ncbi:BMP family lipoprotein [Candidatus Darwinibacter acetoxidans]|nr:BMP family ABC transporter substrate-binding protein [Limnochordia bacterium]MDI9465172.1 BMP family ABC transporter substrate-binding protein [Bacillota bacterium]HOB41123.1 BMP family ABC transporter substrate-binding protein [Limnochordia bacterium]HOK32138.1 BMP family ABC transporter substrate-binding protein [Limnochordia bacterium]HOM00245.1 BMP family ABC transporter substrate-binding protein [Limnochordia bacterium]
MRNKISFVVVMVLLLGLLAAPAYAQKTRVGLIFAEGGLGDQSFNDAAYRGLMQAKEELPVEVIYVEPADIAEMEEHQRSYAELGLDLVIVIGFIHQSALTEVSADYPDIHFAIVDDVVDNPNVTSLLFEEHEGSFLVGVVAGMMTKSNIVGFVGGMEVPLIRKFQVGFEEGVKWANPDAQVLVNYAGAFDDPGRGRELAISQYERGADIIYHAAGGTGSGVIDAAASHDFYAIGVDSDQDYMAPGKVLTSMIKRVDMAVYEVIKAAVEGTLEGGTWTFGVADGGVGTSEFTYTRDIIPQEVFDKVEEAKQKIISGEIVVTNPLQ